MLLRRPGSPTCDSWLTKPEFRVGAWECGTIWALQCWDYLGQSKEKFESLQGHPQQCSDDCVYQGSNLVEHMPGCYFCIEILILSVIFVILLVLEIYFVGFFFWKSEVLHTRLWYLWKNTAYFRLVFFLLLCSLELTWC